MKYYSGGESGVPVPRSLLATCLYRGQSVGILKLPFSTSSLKGSSLVRLN